MPNNTWTFSVRHISEDERIRVLGYCRLLGSSFADRWLISDNETQCDVYFISQDNLNQPETIEFGSVEPIKIVICAEEADCSDYQYKITRPLTSEKMIDVMNAISVNSNELTHNAINRRKNKKVSVKSLLKKFSNANFFNKKKDAVKAETDATNLQRATFISSLKQKLNIDTIPSYKIVFLGNPGSGKTTAIETICGEATLKTEVVASDSVAIKKEQTTIGIDYGEYNFPDTKMRLFGNPGQMRFGFMWNITGKDANAFLILIDMKAIDPVVDFDFYLKILEDKISRYIVVHCALTHCDSSTHDIETIVEKIKQQMKGIQVKLKHRLKIFKFDPRNEMQTVRLLGLIKQQLDVNKIETEAEAEVSLLQPVATQI